MSDPDGSGPGEQVPLDEMLRQEAERIGSPYELTQFQIPAHILEVCSEATAYATPWGVVVVDGGDRAWFQRPDGEWFEWAERRLPPELPSLLMEPPTPTPTPPPPTPPAGCVQPVWIGLGIVGLLILAAVVILLLRSRDPGGPQQITQGASSVPVTTSNTPPSTTAGAAANSTAPGGSSNAGASAQAPAVAATAGQPGGNTRLPGNVVSDGAKSLGIDPAELEKLALVPSSLGWQSTGTPPAQDGPGITSYGAIRVDDQDIFVVVLDRPTDDQGIEGAGTQVTVGRATSEPPVKGMAGFEEGYDERFFLAASGKLEKDPSSAEGKGVVADRQYFLFALPSSDDFVRVGNFFRDTTGATATAQDATSYQISGTFRFSGNGFRF